MAIGGRSRIANATTATRARFNVLAEVRTDRPGTYLVRAWYRGHSPTREAWPTRAEAVEAAKRIWQAYQVGAIDAPQQHAPLTLEDLVERFLARDGLTPQTRAGYTRALALFVRSAGAKRHPETIGPRDVRVWLAAMTCNDTSKRTYLRTLSSLVRWAEGEGWAGDWMSGVDRPSAPEHQIRAWIPTHEWDAFLAACPSALRIRVAWILETGMRVGELTHVREAWIHHSIGRPAVRIAPDGDWRPRVVPLSARAQEVLEEARTRWEGRYVFSGSSRLAATGNLDRDLHAACRRAKVTDCTLHGLRVAAGARWLEDGLSLLEVSRLLGHRDVSTTARHYAGIADRHLAGLMDRVDLAARERQEGAPVIGITRGQRVVPNVVPSGGDNGGKHSK